VLAAKDIVEAIRNKTTLTVLLGLSLMMLTVQALPLLLGLDDRPRLVLSDAERTELADVLRENDDIVVRELRNEADAVSAARQTSGKLLAVVLPSGWNDESGPLSVAGYYVHWLGSSKAAEMATASQEALSEATGRTVSVEATALYPSPDSRGRELMVSIGLVLAIILVTSILVPYLFLDEKSAHTLEVLHVSPASPTQVVMGKGLAGLVYGAIAAFVLLAFNASMVLAWPLMIATVLGGALLGVGIGLFVGLFVENEGTVQLWVGALSMVFMVPLILVFSGADVPEWLRSVMSWLPTSAMFSLFRAAFGSEWPSSAVARDLALLMGSVLLVHVVVVWRLRRWEVA
jgi:ABC-2 type transport system permease protein